MRTLITLPIVAVLLAACSGASIAPALPTAGAGSTPAAPPPAGGTLPASGVMARVINLFADEAGPNDLDIYGFGGTEIVHEPVQVGSVGYGTASDWFDPGYVQGSGDGRTISVAVHRAGEAEQLVGLSDTAAAPGTWITVIVPPPGDFGNRIRGAYDHHPDTERGDVPKAIADQGVLVTSHEGLPDADFERAVFHASVGQSCLPGRFSDPAFEEILGRPAPQPIGNDLVVAPGSYSLTIHRDTGAPGDVAACDGPSDAETPLEIGAGERSYVFLYAAPGDPTVKVLAVPLGS